MEFLVTFVLGAYLVLYALAAPVPSVPSGLHHLQAKRNAFSLADMTPSLYSFANGKVRPSLADRTSIIFDQAGELFSSAGQIVDGTVESARDKIERLGLNVMGHREMMEEDKFLDEMRWSGRMR